MERRQSLLQLKPSLEWYLTTVQCPLALNPNTSPPRSSHPRLLSPQWRPLPHIQIAQQPIQHDLLHERSPRAQWVNRLRLHDVRSEYARIEGYSVEGCDGEVQDLRSTAKTGGKDAGMARWRTR